MLIEAGEVGAASALIRSLLEASTCAFWLEYAASDEQILALNVDPAIGTSDDDIPMLQSMSKALTPFFPAILNLTDGLNRKGSRRALWLHKYTHGSTPQLVRRDRINGWLEGEVILTLLWSDLFAILGASVLTVLSSDSEFRRYVFDQRDVLAEELASKFGIAVPGEQPRAHPASNQTCCGSPLFEVN